MSRVYRLLEPGPVVLATTAHTMKCLVVYRFGHRRRHLPLLLTRAERCDFSGKLALFGKETFYFGGQITQAKWEMVNC